MKDEIGRMKENSRAPKSVPKIRREPSPQHVSDRLRRARNCSSERSTQARLENSRSRSFKFIQSSESIQNTPRCTVESDRNARRHSKLRQMGELTHVNGENSSQLPKRVLKLVVTPFNNDYGHCSLQKCTNGSDELNMIRIYMKVVKELKQEVNNLNVPGSKSPISAFINECFQGTNSSSESSSLVVGSRKELFEYTKTLATECVEIIERVILHQNEIVTDLNNERKLSTKRKIKTLLLNVMLGIEHELILSEQILKIVDTNLHRSSFQFIYCLLKHFIEKIAIHLKMSRGSNLGFLQSPDASSLDSCAMQHTLSGAVISDCKIEEYSNRLDKLLKQWSGTGDSCSKIESSQQVVIDCYHCLSEKKERDLLLKTVSRFTEEIGRKLIECHGGGMRAQFTKNSKKEKIAEASTMEEPSTNDTVWSTEMSTNYSWTYTGENHSQLDGSRSLSQYSNFRKLEPNILSNWSQYYGSARNESNCLNLSPQGRITGNMYPPISNNQNYLSKPQPSAESGKLRMPPPINRSNYHTNHPPVLSDEESFRYKSPITEGNNYHSKSPYIIRNDYKENNKVILAPPDSNNGNPHNAASPKVDDYKYQGSPPLMSSSVNGRNYQAKQAPLLVYDKRFRNKYPPIAEGNNFHTKSPCVIPNANDKPVSNNVNYHHNMAPAADNYGGSSTATPERRNKRRQSPSSMNYLSNQPPMAVGKYYQSISPSGADGTDHIDMPPNRSKGNKNFSIPPPLPQTQNCRLITPPLTLRPFPKLQLPTFDPCRTSGTHCCSHFPRCINQVEANQGHNICEHGNHCKTCLIICENNPKPPYFDRFPGFKGAGFYGNKLNKFQPQMLNTFAVSPELKDQNKKDKNSKKGIQDDKKKTTSDKAAKSSTSTSKGRESLSPFKDGQSLSTNHSPNLSQATAQEEKESKSKLEISRNEQSQILESQKDSIKPKANPEKKFDQFGDKPSPGGPQDENSIGDTPPAGKPSHVNAAKPSTPKNADLHQPSRDAPQKNDNAKMSSQGSKSKEDDVGSSKRPDADRIQEDGHCLCCKCKSNKETVEKAAFFLNPCYCNKQEPNVNRPIFQFFANPVPLNCNCLHKSEGVQKSRSQLTQDQKRDSQDAETQTGKKPEPHLSADQMTPAQSENDQAPCILSSESCTCSVTYSRSDGSRHKRDPGNNEPQKSKSDTAECTCPQDIEGIFQDFDDKYSKCVQEIKLLIREGYLPRYNGSEESFTVTREITIVPSRSKSACKDDNPSKEPPHHQLEFHESQDKIYSDDTCRETESHDKYQTPTDLRADIEELKRLIKNTRFGLCPCCKCCKCEKDGKSSEECSKPQDQNEPGKYKSEPHLVRDQPPSKYSEEKKKEPNKKAENVEELRKKPARGSKHNDEPEKKQSEPSTVQDTLPPTNYFSKMVEPKGAKDKPGKYESEPSSVPGKQPAGSEGVEESAKNANQRRSTKEQQPYQPSTSINETSPVRFETPTKNSGSETVGLNKELSENFKTKSESGKYQSEPSSLEVQPPIKRAPYSDKEIEEANQVPPEGSKMIHITPSYMDPEELPTVIKELIVPSSETTQLDSKKQAARKSQDQDQAKPQRQSDTETPQQGKTQSSRSNNAPRSLPSKGSIGVSNKTSETKPEGGKDSSKIPQSSDLKNSYGRSSKSAQESRRTTEHLHRESEAGGGSHSSNLDQTRTKGSLEKNNKPKIGGRSLGPMKNYEPGKSDNSLVSKSGASGSTAGISFDSEPGKNVEIQKTTGPDQGPSFEAEGEYSGVKRASKGSSETKKGERKSNNELAEEKETEASMQNESEIGKTRRDLSQGRKTSKKPGSVSEGTASSPKDKRKNSLAYDDEAVKQRQMSLERRALDQSRDQLFTNRGGNEVSTRRSDEDVKRSWTPFEGIFGSSSGKVEDGSSKSKGKSDDVGGNSRKTDKSYDSVSDVPCGSDDDEDTFDDDFSNPCGSPYASSSTINDCKDLFDSRPCGFHSDESGTSSITEVIKATETELYVMIIESQPPLAQTPDRHDEIISLLLSGTNNVPDFSGNSNPGNRLTSKTINVDNYPQISSPNNSYGTRRSFQNGRDTQSCFPVELITVQPSDESIQLDSDIESSEVLESGSSNDQLLSLERVCSSSLNIINKEMKERSEKNSKQEEDPIRSSSLFRKHAEKKKRSSLKTQKRLDDKETKGEELQDTVEEFDKSMENKEVQVTKWNAKVQTAGPRKFNRTDIPREVEDKLAKYLGLERTVEQMDLKTTSMKEKSQIPKESPNQKESKRSSEKNRQNGKLQKDKIASL